MFPLAAVTRQNTDAAAATSLSPDLRFDNAATATTIRLKTVPSAATTPKLTSKSTTTLS